MPKKTLKIETIPIDKIYAYENNAKLHPQEQIDQIVKSMQEFGNNDPIAIDENNQVIEGHGRLLALKQMGEKEAPVIRLSHLSEEQKKAYILVHNQLTLNTGFDEELLKTELESIVGIDMGDFGFDLDIVDLEEETTEAVEDVDFDPTPPEEPKTKRGDLYRLGEHYLLCGDSTSAEDVKRLMSASGEEEQIDLFCSDPPYGVSYVGGTDESLTIQNDSLTDDELQAFLTDIFINVNDHLKPGGSFYIWHASSTALEFLHAMRAVGWVDRQQLVWVKNSMVLGRSDFQWRHEPCFYGWKSGAAHNWHSDRKQTTVLEFDKPARNGDHPTMKPVPLIAYQVECSTKRGEIVFDACSGSGTIGIACEQTGRRARMMEIDERYCDVIVRRWEELTGEKAILLNGAEVAEEKVGA